MAKSNQYKIESDLSEVKVLASYFRDFCNENQIDESNAGLAELALVESLNNVIIHAYDNKPGLEIIAEYEYNDSEISITVKDYGKPFKRIEKDKSIDTNVEDLPEGNWGIDLISSITDEIIRHRENDTNILILKKRINT